MTSKVRLKNLMIGGRFTTISEDSFSVLVINLRKYTKEFLHYFVKFTTKIYARMINEILHPF